MKTFDAAQWNWGIIFERFGLPPIDPRKHYLGECPICSRKGKFRVDDRDGRGTWICVCGSGDGFKLLQESTGKDFKTVAAEVDRIIGNNFKVERRQPTQSMSDAAKARDRFISLPSVRGTDGEHYLQNRGIFKMPRRGMRYSGGQWDRDAGRMVPALYSIASNEYGEPVFLHLTYIESGEKADVPVQKKMHSLHDYPGSVAVKLSESTEVLGICEGIESALSAESIYKVPTWSTLTASIMQKFRAPTGVRTLYIFADNDRNGTGLAAAFACGKANILSKNDVIRVVVRWPKTLGDFNDMLLQGDEVCEWELTK